jgi:hypothetical protein
MINGKPSQRRVDVDWDNNYEEKGRDERIIDNREV